ncbi:SCP2 sterol-binding domain-containing protein [Oceanicella actignis]|uniref:SCP-2 sterol transfer family protein n=1 Tax=Oceanicella actignis TaxID=1189325 RepID=A0A1M7TX71_9RHOB|nr:SCP2 sterol-binding domain-containing protein [Oceanicella actignis]TYO89590.1 SCP-2 sterol transfer family protein [Oceanicella actignis]SET79899.1 SCP-2 sterol transfer family protein [Oceanicella actignis]SHN75295.1 SCP-2 sterol transfer family protein [Oceanicella actignis]
MSDTLNAAVAALREKLGDGSFDGSVKFEIEGEGAVRIEGGEVSIDDSDADCTIRADAETFKAMVSGDLNPTSAFMAGKLSVDGDMSKAMALGSVLG